MVKRITMTIKGQKCTVETDGYSGTSCMEASEALERALGGDRNPELKSEYYDNNTVTEEVQS